MQLTAQGENESKEKGNQNLGKETDQQNLQLKKVVPKKPKPNP